MGKILRLISTIMIGVGLVFLFVYINIQKTGAEQVLNNPSYYVAQNYWLVFLAGIAVLAFSLMGSFFSWFKNIDKKEEVLLNAGYTSAEHIDAMLRGSTAEQTAEQIAGIAAAKKAETQNTDAEKTVAQRTTPMPGAAETTVMPGAVETVVMPDVVETTVMPGAAETVVMPDVVETTVMPDAETVLDLEPTVEPEPVVEPAPAVEPEPVVEPIQTVYVPGEAPHAAVGKPTFVSTVDSAEMPRPREKEAPSTEELYREPDKASADTALPTEDLTKYN